MKPGCSTQHSTLHVVLLSAALTPLANAQTQAWFVEWGARNLYHIYGSDPDHYGGVFLCGRTNGSIGAPNAGFDDAWLAHYDQNYDRTWIRQLGTSGFEFAVSVLVDTLGGVYLSGHTTGNLDGANAGLEDVWLAHYDEAGNQTWIRQFGSREWEFALATALDHSGGVYVCGGTYGSLAGPSAGSQDAWLARYNSAGEQMWIRQFGSIASEWANSIAVDDLGGILVSGPAICMLDGGPAGELARWLAHYDSAGNQTWIRQFSTNGYDYAWAGVPVGSDGVYANGYMYGSLCGQNVRNCDSWPARYNGAGNQIWARLVGADTSDVALAAASAGACSVPLDAYTDGGLGGPHAGDREFLSARHESAASQTCTREFGVNDYGQAAGVETGSWDGVYANGYTYRSLSGHSAGNRDGWPARHDNAMNQTWAQRYAASGYDHPIPGTQIGADDLDRSGITAVSIGGPKPRIEDARLGRYDNGLSTSGYRTQEVPNSTRESGVMAAIGNNPIQANDIMLFVSHLPVNVPGFFLTSLGYGNVSTVRSHGGLCLNGWIDHFVVLGEVMSSGATGSFSLATAMAPTYNPVIARPGHTWHFKAWHRDANHKPTSQFTDAVSAMVQ
jgi:hypothetical protein